MSTRDRSLDRFRGFAMLWVLVVHTLYWGMFISVGLFNLIKSFALFEMPLFFFITGAGNSFGKSNKNYFRFVYDRFKRILIPYWIFAVICAAVSVWKSASLGTFTLRYSAKILLSWLIPVDRQITDLSRLTWALWFIPVYLCIVLLLPILLKIKQTKFRYLCFIPLILFFAVTAVLKLGWVQNPAFYFIWTYAGLFYSELKAVIKKSRTRILLVCAFLFGVLSLFAVYRMGYSLDMQNNKFPPNIVFLFFSIMMMAFLYLIAPYLDKVLEKIEDNKIFGKIFCQFSLHSMTVFLYQVFAFLVTIRLTNTLIVGTGMLYTALRLIFCFVTTVIICAGFGATFGYVEQLGRKRK